MRRTQIGTFKEHVLAAVTHFHCQKHTDVSSFAVFIWNKGRVACNATMGFPLSSRKLQEPPHWVLGFINHGKKVIGIIHHSPWVWFKLLGKTCKHVSHYVIFGALIPCRCYVGLWAKSKSSKHHQLTGANTNTIFSHWHYWRSSWEIRCAFYLSWWH